VKYSDEMLAQCACTRVRTVSRLVTKIYDDILRPTGLKASQLASLAAIDSMDAPSIVALSKTLQMDRTTLSRNLLPLIAAGLVVVQEEGYGRSKATKLTSKGNAMLKAAYPLWLKAQGDLRRKFGKDLLEAMGMQLQRLTHAANE
jgi:DNA-binding MarR family transcriptional regulator